MKLLRFELFEWKNYLICSFNRQRHNICKIKTSGRVNFLLTMESSALEALISKFLEELKSLVGSDSRFDFDE